MIKLKKLLSVIVGVLGLFVFLSANQAFADISGDYTYTQDGSNATITDYNGLGGDITIPDNLDLYPVSAIAANAFQNKALTSVTIPDTVVNIGDYAFADNGLLSYVYFSGLSTGPSLGGSHVFFGVSFSFKVYYYVTNLSFPGIFDIYSTEGWSGGGSDFVYTNDGVTATITDYIGAGGDITIPSTLDSYPVSGIASHAFNNKSLTSVVIPDSITNIAMYAFDNNANLTALNIPSSVNFIGFPVSYGSGISSYTVDPSNTYYSSEDGVLFNKNKTVLYSYPQWKTGDTYNIPSNTVTIDSSAFMYNANIETIYIPDSVTGITSLAFRYTSSLSAINVDTNNTYYSSEDGVLFNKAKTELIIYPQGKANASYYYIPNTITSIGQFAFNYNSFLTTLHIPDTVTSIGGYAFEYMTNLSYIDIPDELITIGDGAFRLTKISDVTFPSSITSIGSSAFYGISSLSYAFFLGNAPQMGSNVFAQVASSFKVYYGTGSTGFTNPWNGYTTEVSSQITNMKADRDALTSSSIKGANADLSNIYSSLVLPTTGTNGSTIVWSSNSPSVVSNNGQTIVRPAYASGDTTVVMTATITSGSFLDTKSFTLVVKKLASSQIQATPTVTVDTTQKEVLVNSQVGTTVTIPSSVTDATINVSALTSDNSTITTATLPAITLNATTSLSTTPVKVEIPSSTVITAPTGWNGTINVPQVRANSTVTATPDSGKTASVDSVIEVGYGDVKLTFSKAVRILIPGKAGKDAGYSRGGVFTSIPNTCSADTQLVGDALTSEGDCKISVASDLIIWTKHFTTFVAYTQTAIASRQSSSGSSVQKIDPIVVDMVKGCLPGYLFSVLTGERCSKTGSDISTPSELVVDAGASGVGIGKIVLKETLKVGLKGEEVKALQNLLNKLGYDCGKADGNFGRKTKAAVIKFQIAKKLTPDGKVGVLTASVLNK